MDLDLDDDLLAAIASLDDPPMLTASGEGASQDHDLFPSLGVGDDGGDGSSLRLPSLDGFDFDTGSGDTAAAVVVPDIDSQGLMVDPAVQQLALALAGDPRAMALAKTLCKAPVNIVVNPKLSKKRRKKKFVAECDKDDKYWARRAKNTALVRRNREKLKQNKQLALQKKHAHKELLQRTGAQGYGLLVQAVGGGAHAV